MKWGTPTDYLYLLRTTNSEQYTRRFLLWLKDENPELHKIMDAQLEKLRGEFRSQSGEDLPAPWLRK